MRLVVLAISLSLATAGAASEVGTPTGRSVPSAYRDTHSEIVPRPTDTIILQELEPVTLAIAPDEAKKATYADLQGFLAIDSADRCFRLTRQPGSTNPEPDLNDGWACTFMKLGRAEHRRSTGCDEPVAETGGFDFRLSCTRIDGRWAVFGSERSGRRYALAYFRDKPIVLSTGILHDRIAVFCLIAAESGGVYITHFLLHPRFSSNTN